MDSASNIDYRNLISKLIKKQLLILGPDITFLKVKNVKGLTIDANGEILGLVGDPKSLFDDLTSQFIMLSGSVVKQTLETIHQAQPVLTTSTMKAENLVEDQPQIKAAEHQSNPSLVSQPQIPPQPQQKVVSLEPKTHVVEITKADPLSSTQKNEPPKFTTDEIEKLNMELEKLNTSLASSK